MKVRAVAILFVILTGCDARQPIAQGNEAQIAAATRAARACGVIELRHDPLDDQNSMLLIGKRNTQASVDCTMRWIRTNAPELLAHVEKES